MADEISTLLRKTGPTLSSVLVRQLSEKGVSYQTARKRVSRARGAVKRVGGLSLPNREQFLYLSEQAKTGKFFDRLAGALKQTKSSYGRALTALEARQGGIPKRHFSAASGLPVEPTKGQIMSSRVLNELCKVGLFTLISTPHGDVVALREGNLTKRRRATLTVEEIVLGAIRSWLVNLGWSSSRVVKIRSSEYTPKFGQYQFDLVGPCYLSSLREAPRDRLLNGFIVGDILLDREIRLADLDPFLAKLAVLTAQRRRTRFQPIFIADRFYPDALDRLRAKGCFIARPETVFGAEAAAELRGLIDTIENAAELLTKEPHNVFFLLEKIAKLEGASFNLRSVILELLVGHLFQVDGYGIEIRKLVRSSGGDGVEIDIQATNQREAVFIECKGKSTGILVSVHEITVWIEKTIPRIKSWLRMQSNYAPEHQRFEFYAATGYTEEAKAMIPALQASETQSLQFLTGRDVISRLRKNNETSLVDIFREHFGDGKTTDFR
jgi:hypothetical protein